MKKRFGLILLLFSSLITSSISAADSPPPPADTVFKTEFTRVDANTLLAKWSIKPSYSLYKERISFKLEDTQHAELGLIRLPAGKEKSDEVLGLHHVLQGELAVPVRLVGLKTGQTQLQVHYQGCSDSGFCYPPQTKLLQLTINKDLELSSVEPAAPKAEASSLSKEERLLSQGRLGLIILGFVVFGLLLAFTPCVLPMVPILSGIIVGQGDDITTRKAFGLSLSYVLAMSVTYGVMGLLIAMAGSNLQIIMQHPTAITLFSFLFVLLALSMFGFYDLSMPQGLQSRLSRFGQQGSGYLSAIVMGILATLILSPCVTPALVAVLTYIAKTGDALLGGVALFSLGLGVGIPLLLVGISAGSLLPKAGVWMNQVKGFFGVLLLGMAIYLISRIVPSEVTMLLWASLFIITGHFLSRLNTFWQGVRLILITYGIFLMIGASTGSLNPLDPLANLSLKGTVVSEESGVVFEQMNSVSEINQALGEAKTKGQRVFVDIYADWCTSCQLIERYVFSKPEVAKALSDYRRLKVDVTRHNETTQAFLDRFEAVGPPTLIFIGPNGEEFPNSRITGEISKQAFLEQLSSLKK